MFEKSLTSKGSKNKIFHEFCVFKYALWNKTKTQKRQKTAESLLDQKSNQC